MNETNKLRQAALLLGAIFMLGTGGHAGAAPAGAIVEKSGVAGGFCVVLGGNDAALPMAIGKEGPFVVQTLCPDEKTRDAFRAAIREGGQYGAVSAVALDDADHLPYSQNLINLVVVRDPALGAPLRQEIGRVLAPFGVCVVEDGALPPADVDALFREAGLERLEGVSPAAARKPWPREIDEWGHFLHGPDGNPVARDEVVAPPERYRWVSEPRWLRSHETDSSVSTLVTSHGRLFSIIDEAPIGLPGQHSLPDKWSLVAQDAFNGVVLWKVPIHRWGWREWKTTWFTNRPGDFPLNRQKRLVAAGDKVYVTLGYRAPVSQLDAATGEILQTYDGTERTSEILHLDGTLILSVQSGKEVRVVSVNAESGKTNWTTSKAYGGTTTDYLKFTSRYADLEQPDIDPTLNTATDGKVVAFLDGKDIVAIDFATGDEKWRREFPRAEADANAGSIPAGENLWVGTMIVSDGVVIHASPNKLAGFAADSGDLLWEQPKKYIGHLWYEWKDVFVIDGLVWTWSDELLQETFKSGVKGTQKTLAPVSVKGYDLHSGKLAKEVPLGNIFKTQHHHRCYRNKATTHFILASRRGTEYVDLAEGKHTVHNWVRGTCHVGMMPANGLQYAPPHPCRCYIDEKLSGMIALAPAASLENPVEPAGGPESGPAFGEVKDAAEAGAEDWPAFRRDSLRSGSVQTAVPAKLRTLWEVRPGGKASPPTVVGGRLYFSLIDEHQVVCLDAGDGHEVWRFFAGARIDSQPAWYRGMVLFGSMDGSVYCLRASDGELVWRFRAAPGRRAIGAFGQLESAWPVHGSVLVLDDVVYLTAGRSSQLDGGITLYALDVFTGEKRHETALEGPDYDVENMGEVNFGLPMGTLADILSSDGERIYMRSAAFEKDLYPARGTPEMSTTYGFLDDTYFKRIPWKYGQGNDYGRLMVCDQRSVYYVRMFDSLRGLDPTVFFTPGQQGYLLVGKDPGKEKNSWMERIPVRIRAMALTPERLFVAGPPDVVDPKDPLGAFEGRKGGLLYVFDTAAGKELAHYPLDAAPAFNGIAAARSRIYLTGDDGSVVCFGGE